MVDILSSLRTMWRPGTGPGTGDDQSFREGPRSVVLGFPVRKQRDRSKADLARMIESEIIPRLMLAHSSIGVAAAASSSSVGPRTLEVFARMTVSSDADALTAYVETLIQGGMLLQTAYTELLIPTARGLGDAWNEDEISFTDVTIGLSRLQQVVRNLGRRFPTRDAAPGAPSACFVPAPGEQHTFGLFMLEDGFRRAGWRTWLDTAATAQDAAGAVAHDWFDVFGLSATSDTPIDVITATLKKVRKASQNPRLFVMVGGRLFSDEPDLAAVVGADAVADNVAGALYIADEAVEARVSA